MAQLEETEPTQPSQPESYFEIPSNIDEPTESSTHQPPQPQAQNSYKPSNGPWFTFDDIPTVKWREKLSEMSAWVDLQMIRSGATIESVLKELVTRFTGSLRHWFDSLGPYRQLQFVQLPNVSSALAILHEQFIGESSTVFEAARRDYLNMKCCSLNTKDLDFHYKRMSILFYKLNGFNDHTLKHVFLASLPTDLQQEIQRQLTVHNLNLDNISLGKIFQIAKGCLEKLYEQKQFFKELVKDKEPFRSSHPWKRTRRPYDETVFALENSSDNSENDEFQSIFHQQSLSLNTTIPIPSIKLQILPSKIQRPIPVIGFLDTGAQKSMMNSDILPAQNWKPHTEHFRAVDGKMFTTELITKKPIGIQIFPNCVIWTKIIGSKLPNKDILIRLPFKLNEDINPTKATHLGMSPSDLALAQKECSQLLAQGLIEPTNSQWAYQQLTKKQIQQFLGIINYIRDFIPHVDQHTNQLSALLKKKPPEWNDNHTLAVTTLKKIAQNSSPLKLITDGNQILQTAASDESWGVILLEEINGKESFIAYASGHFSDTQQHYHSVYKEILAVKNGIKKFEYHLIGYHFLIRMDISAFPNIMNFKGKTVPEKMLLRLKD
ncbi:hypothetical protein KPL71_001165 [Citrus sinensis]|uniref:Uncharacterized protein n=1 Tax=Citrus sinensis TaxID=2711 RepID=A0ACB8NV80_CITSI|nr:hypothetical protein KPL71_001165 [Citrus sinensis]